LVRVIRKAKDEEKFPNGFFLTLALFGIYPSQGPVGFSIGGVNSDGLNQFTGRLVIITLFLGRQAGLIVVSSRGILGW